MHTAFIDTQNCCKQHSKAMRNRYYDNVNQTLIWIFIVDDKVNDSNKVIKGLLSRHCCSCPHA